MENENDIMKEAFEKIPNELDEHIKELEQKIKQYGSFNIIANAMLHNDLRSLDHYVDYVPGTQPTAPEYLSLIALKNSFSLGIKELTNPMDAPKDFFEINELVNKIIAKYTFLHYRKYNTHGKDGKVSDITQIAQLFSSNELLVRNPTFESFHWDLLEDLYEKYDDYFKEVLGFSTNDAIRICETIADYIKEGFEEALQNIRNNSKQMYDEIIAFKYKNKRPKNFYPDDYLAHYKTLRDDQIKRHFQEAMYTHEISMLGYKISFTALQIAEMEEIDVGIVQSFLDKLSLNFGDINPDFSRPEIIHPLKDKPVLNNKGTYLCPSTALLDYSLDRLFAESLLRNKSKREKYKEHRHNYLLNKGIELISTTLKSDEVFKNLEYPGGEMDGLILCDSNVFFIEAKGHRITDRAKKGYIDRIEGHIKEIIQASHSQALRTFTYLFGKSKVVFTDQRGKEVILDGSKYQNAYFISLTLEDLSAISCNLKVNNSIYLFEKDSFPWIVSLYDLRAVCEHMEGPAYLIQYLHRRKEFFRYDKFSIQDELDILGYYLKRNLRFDELIQERYDQVSLIHLDSYLDEFNRYYNYTQGYTKKPYPKMVHHTILPVKNLIKALEESGLPYGKDAGAQILEFSTKTKQELMEYIKKVKKMFVKHGDNHDFRLLGDDVNKHTWMFSYWVGPDNDSFIKWFEDWIRIKFKEEPTSRYIAILDVGKNNYEIAKIINLQTITHH